VRGGRGTVHGPSRAAVRRVAGAVATVALVIAGLLALPALLQAQGTFGAGADAYPTAVPLGLPTAEPYGIATSPGAGFGQVPGWPASPTAQGLPGAQGAGASPVFTVRPAALDLSGAPRTAEVWVEGAPPAGGFQFELTYDPALAAVTAVDAGDWLSSTGGSVLLTPRFSGAGTLVIGGVATLPEGVPAPEGTGALAFVTLAPLAPGGPSSLGLGEGTLVGPSGDEIPAAAVPGSLTISAAMPEPALGEAVAQATALADELGVGSGLWPDLPDVQAYGAELVWLGFLALALSVVAIGWVLGRRPPASSR
jgi:hypothetical protein